MLRHVKARFIEGGRVSGTAFRLRENEAELSFNWMEFDFYRNHTAEEQVALIAERYPLRLSRRDQFASLNVGAAKRFVLREHPAAKAIDFIEDGRADNPSHCLMKVPEIDDMVGDLLAQCVLQRFPAIVHGIS